MSRYACVRPNRKLQFIKRVSLENLTLPLSRGAGGGAGIGEEDPREVAPMPFVLWILFIRYGANTTVSIFTTREGFKKTKMEI